MKKSMTTLIAVVLLLGFSIPASATLFDRGGGLIYDDVLNITWLQDTNYAQTSGYDADGLMTWEQALAWVDQLSYGGFDNWRLPTTVDGTYSWGYDGTTTAGYNITSSEMGYMYYVNLGNKGYYDTSGNPGQPGWSSQSNATFVDGNNQTVSFVGLQSLAHYSGTAYSAGGAWYFGFSYGEQDTHPKTEAFYAWAVLPGDVPATPVPEPATMLLLGSGLAGLAGFRRNWRRDSHTQRRG